jgi:hypothetical protein
MVGETTPNPRFTSVKVVLEYLDSFGQQGIDQADIHTSIADVVITRPVEIDPHGMSATIDVN